MDLARSLRDAVAGFGAAAAAYDYDDYDDGYADEAYAARDDREQRYEDRLEARRRRAPRDDGFDDIYDDGPPRRLPAQDARPLALVRPRRVELALVAPKVFEDAQYIADRFRAGLPVFVDLQACDAELAARLVDFCSGLTYALDGGVQTVGEALLVLTPGGVDLSGQPALGLDAKGFYNRV
jgi:cell division inhibitor SepF